MAARKSSWLAPAPPTVAIEIASRRVTAVSVEHSAAGPVVAGQATELLPEGAVVPALTSGNIKMPNAVVDALGQALDRAGLRSARRAALVVPDSVARVSLLTFDAVPPRPDDLDRFMRWQLKKSTPFAIEDAQVSYFPVGGPGGAAPTMMAGVVSRRDVIAEYEAVASAVGVHAGIVDLASFNVMNAIVGVGGQVAGDWLLVHLAAEATSLAIIRGDQLMFYRHRTAVDEESLGSLVHQTAMYHEDRLGGGDFARVWLSGGGAATDAARAEVSARLNVSVGTFDIASAAGVRDRGTASTDLADTLAAPVGILIRERAA
jgi:Tfp pilus assembly PilM family ATPase